MLESMAVWSGEVVFENIALVGECWQEIENATTVVISYHYYYRLW